MTLQEFIQAALHFDQTLTELAGRNYIWFFGLVTLIIFIETGLVLFPFLPGDSMLFVAGALCAALALPIFAFGLVLIAAAVIGDNVNYAVGRHVGDRVWQRAGQPGFWRFVKPEYLQETEKFFERYGGFTIILGRFVPFVRTFAPFMAGVGKLPMSRFFPLNLIGGAAWIASILAAGYAFGNIPWVKKNLGLVVIGIVVLSVMPIILKIIAEKRGKGIH